MNATVTMSVSELDSLRSELSSAKSKLAEFEKNEKSITVIEYSIANLITPHKIETYKGVCYGTAGEIIANKRWDLLDSVATKVVSKKNLEDIQSIFQEEARLKVQVDLDKLSLENNRLRQEVRDLNNKHAKIDKLKTSLEEAENKAEQLTKELEDSKKIIKDIENNIIALEKDLKKEKIKKGFWSFLS